MSPWNLPCGVLLFWWSSAVAFSSKWGGFKQFREVKCKYLSRVSIKKGGPTYLCHSGGVLSACWKGVSWAQSLGRSQSWVWDKILPFLIGEGDRKKGSPVFFSFLFASRNDGARKVDSHEVSVKTEPFSWELTLFYRVSLVKKNVIKKPFHTLLRWKHLKI